MAKNMGNITNFGSAIGEAIGAMLETEIHRVLRPLAEQFNCTYVKTGPLNKKGKDTKLILKDINGNGYNIDSVIINNRFQPLVLLESKYIRYKKHNRDKASWICTAHPKLRETYPTIRKSIAVLMGNWSLPSKRLLQSFDVDIFEISFADICQVLARHDITFNWGEKERDVAMDSWNKFSALSDEERSQLAEELIGTIRADIEQSITQALTDSEEEKPQTIASVKLVVKTEKGETHVFEFSTFQEAMKFMQDFDPQRDLDTANKLSLPELAFPSSEVEREEIEFLEEEEEKEE